MQECDTVVTRNIRHWRVFRSVARTRSPMAAAQDCLLSQPAVTLALAKLERGAGGALFSRARQGFYLTDRGKILHYRVDRALSRLDRALADISPRLLVTATSAQLLALCAVVQTRNFTLAARKLGLAQPSVHRAVSLIESAAQIRLFDRTALGMMATRLCQALAHATQLAFAEIEQAQSELNDVQGRDTGRIVVGALPLSRSELLPNAITQFRQTRPHTRIEIIDGPYDPMITSLRHGEIDMIIGAIRDPAPIDDILQEPLFHDRLVILAKKDHPMVGQTQIAFDKIIDYPWVLPRPFTPAREQFDAHCKSAGLPSPQSVVECGSVILMREILLRGDALGCFSENQSQAEVRNGLLAVLETDFNQTGRSIGITTRKDWHPTPAQSIFMDQIRASAQFCLSDQASACAAIS